MKNDEFNFEEIEPYLNQYLHLEEEEDSSFEITGTWGSAGTFASTVGGCASTAGSASSFS
ncbi:thiocillin family RiPP [Staphylococcus sp. GSSP0090]|nr:thiocillin family RiPP [Staphylococcus sp. GSSP0090]